MRDEEKDIRRPVFIVGAPRSGTTILAHAIATHERFWTSNESDFLYVLFGRTPLPILWHEMRYMHPDYAPGWLVAERVSYEEFCEHLGRGIADLFRSRAGGARWVDATPTYTLMLDTLALMFPDAQFIHILRDGREVVNSMTHSGFNQPWATDFAEGCRTWAYYASTARSFVKSVQDRAMELRYEQLRDEPDAAMATVFNFLGVEPSPDATALIRLGRINSSFGNTEPSDVFARTKPEEVSPRDPWDHWTDEQRATFQQISGDTLRAGGYEPEPDPGEVVSET
ncbi:MAG: sulfotransferase [Planctomycetota bacterium]